MNDWPQTPIGEMDLHSLVLYLPMLIDTYKSLSDEVSEIGVMLKGGGQVDWDMIKHHVLDLIKTNDNINEVVERIDDLNTLDPATIES